MKLVAILFLGLVVAIITAANFGWAEPIFAAVRTVPYSDKICHFLLLGGLCYCIATAITVNTREKQRRVALYTALGLVAISTVEEFSQIFISSRTFSPSDLISNYAGIAFFGWLAYRKTRKHKPKQDDKS